MYTTDECKINGLQLTELKYENLVGTPMIAITYALTQVNPKTQKLVHTHGKVTATGTNLSIATLELLQKFIEAAEQDLQARHFNTQVPEKRVTQETEDASTGATTAEQENVGQF